VHHTSKEYVAAKFTPTGSRTSERLFKRGLIGSFHKISIKHLDRYLAEFCYRFNSRQNEELFMMTVLYMVIAQAMPYDSSAARRDTSGQG
jgi:hypothetical protein